MTELELVERGACRWLAGPAGQPLMGRMEDVRELVQAAMEHQAGGILLFAENLPPGFVNLSTGTAGEVLQKLQAYHIRLAVVMDLAATPHSPYFAGMVREARRGRDFRVCATRHEAEDWLCAAESNAAVSWR